MTESQQKKDDKCCRKLIRKAPVFFLGIAFAVACFIAINLAMKPVSSPQYCGSSCHEMQTAYQTWKLSEHGANRYGISVDCSDCHLPSKDKYFTRLIAKVYTGAKDTYRHHFGDEYNVEEIRQKVIATMPNERCMKCHNDLLGKPGSSAARLVHQEVLNEPDESQTKCIDCHEDVAHQRQKQIYSP